MFDEKAGELIVNWFKENGRDLPWRRTKNPYHIVVSEIMLQQTRVQTVIPYYLRFLEKLPTIEDLAMVSDEELHILWEGLGYYSRAERLKKFANEVVEEYNGIVPDDREKLLKLSGIGPYTVGAILSFAFHKKAVAVDGNVMRVLARLACSTEDIMKEKTRESFRKSLYEIVPKDVYSFNQGIMELGATLCTPKNPSCDLCPLQHICVAKIEKKQEVIPVKKKKKAPKEMCVPVFMIRNKKGQVLLTKRKAEGLLKRQWGLPIIEEHIGELDKLEDRVHKEGIKQHTRVISEKVRGVFNQYIEEELGQKVVAYRFVKSNKHVFSHVIWHQYVFEVELENFNQFERDIQENMVFHKKLTWYEEGEQGVPTAFKKIIR